MQIGVNRLRRDEHQRQILRLARNEVFIGDGADVPAEILTQPRRRLLAQSALATTALIAAPYVRGAHAAGKLAIGFWDHWVPGANNTLTKLCNEWGEKNKVEVKPEDLPEFPDSLDLGGNEMEGILINASRDGMVDSGDLGLLLLDWGTCPVPSNCPADLDHSGEVDAADYTLYRDSLGQAVPAFTGADGSGLAANLVLASPSGASGAATYRALAAVDIYNSPVTGINDVVYTAVDAKPKTTQRLRRLAGLNGIGLGGRAGQFVHAPTVGCVMLLLPI